MSLKAKKGLYNGKIPLGYTKKKDEFPVIEESEAHIVRTIFSMYTSGRDKNYITRYLNEKGFRTKTGKLFDADGVTYILENPFYIGKIRWNRRESSHNSALKDESEWIVVDSHHEPLITREMFEAAQRRTQEVRTARKKYSHPVSHGKHWLSGLVKCSICGKSLSFKAGNKGRPNNFQCLGYRMGLHKESQAISERKLTAAVLQSLHMVRESGDATFSLIHTQITNEEAEKIIFESELRGLDAKESRIREAYMAGVDTLEEYKLNKELLDRRRRELTTRLDELQTAAPTPESYKEQFLKTVSSVIDILESDADYCTKGTALRGIVQKIIFYKETQTLEFHYFLSV